MARAGVGSGGRYAAIALGVIAIAGLAFMVVGPEPSSGTRADPDDATQVALGRAVYDSACASCHGAELEGQPDWKTPLATGGYPAPPHDETGHTWHHPDELLFRVTKNGGATVAPEGMVSNMPAFARQLEDDEIWAVLAYIKSRWPGEIRRRHAEISARAAK